MNEERLRHMISILQTVKKEKKPFDLAHWVAPKSNECGTSACAMGYAMMDPVFQEQGLRAYSGASDFEKTLPRALRSPYKLTPKAMSQAIKAGPLWQNWCHPYFGGVNAFGAAAKFFGISHYDANTLFSPRSYRKTATPQMVITRIRRLIRDGDSVYAEPS